MDTSKTTFRKSSDGWEGKDTIDLSPAKDDMGRDGMRKLTIHTYKRSHGGIHTYASCALHSDGMMCFEIYGDYSKSVAKQEGTRCTEKSIRTLHASVMVSAADAILAEARAFYEAKDAKKALHARRDAELAEQDQKSAFDYPEAHAAGCSG